MNRFQHILLFILLFLFGTGGLHAHNFSSADRKFNNLKYTEAIPIYQKGLQKDSTNKNAWMRLGDCYRLTNQPDLAENCYSKVVRDPQTPAKYKLYYAQALLTNGNDDKAKEWFSDYSAANPSDAVGKDFVEFIDSKYKFVQDSNRFVINKININSENAEFGAVTYDKGIVFASSRLKSDPKKNKIDPWTGKPFISMYYSIGNEDKFSEPELFTPLMQINSNNGPVTFNPNGTELFFSGNNSNEAVITDENLKTEKLSIYCIKIDPDKYRDGKFSDPKPFEYNSNDYSMAHPFLNADGSKLYFSSDMPGTKGGMDIWVCERSGDHWSTPENLGSKINTTGNEVYPTVGNDGTVYFSSNGLPGIGGLDIFYTFFTGDEYVEPKNIGAPINSSDDDFSLCFDINTSSGYLSSNRLHQNSNDDILSIKSNLIPLMGIIVDKLTNEPCNGCTVNINKDGDNVGILKTDNNGKFRVSMIPEKTYSIISTNQDYVNDTIFFTASRNNLIGDSLSLSIKLENTYAPNNVLVWNSVLYDLAKFDIREDAARELDRLVELMKSNQKLKIELSSHTDCRATDKYNMILSEKRAASAVAYLVSQGIEAARLVPKGYGEMKPINNCDCNVNNGKDFTEEEHQQNRRTEIKVLESTEVN